MQPWRRSSCCTQGSWTCSVLRMTHRAPADQPQLPKRVVVLDGQLCRLARLQMHLLTVSCPVHSIVVLLQNKCMLHLRQPSPWLQPTMAGALQVCLRVCGLSVTARRSSNSLSACGSQGQHP